MYHNPVMLKETIKSLDIKSNGIYVDLTFGGGGHSNEILKCLGKNGKLIAFDQDDIDIVVLLSEMQRQKSKYSYSH